MKTRSKITAVITAILLTVEAAGCKNSMLDTLGDIEKRAPEVSVYTKIKGTVTNYSEVILETVNKNDYKPNANIRTVAPTLDAFGYKFFLFGVNGASFCGPFTLTDELIGSNGTFDASVPPGIWNLTLVAFASDQTFADKTADDTIAVADSKPGRSECTDASFIEENALLLAKAHVDLTKNSDNDVNFVLSPEGLKKDGYVSFTIVLDDWTSRDKGVTAKAGLYDLKTGEPIKYGTDKSANKETITFTKAGASERGKDGKDIAENLEKADYELKDGGNLAGLLPGTYTFSILFESSTGKQWTWNDRLMVFPGTTTNETIYISRLIMDKPKAPEYLYASVAKGPGYSAHDTATPADPRKYKPSTDNSGRMYQVVFDWADWDSDGNAINNEKYFELQIADVSGITDTDYTTATTPDEFNADGTIKVKHASNIWIEDADHNPENSKYTQTVIDYANKKYQYELDGAGYLPWKIKTKEVADIEGNITTYDESVFNQLPVYVDGSLLANNRSITLYLDLGKDYVARIRAKNDTDASEWVYAKLEPEPGHTAPGITGTPTLSGMQFQGTTINNYYIRFMLKGGSGENLSGDYVDFYGPSTNGGFTFPDFFLDGDKNEATPKPGLAYNGMHVTGWKDGPEANSRDYYISKPTAKASTYTGDGTNYADPVKYAHIKTTNTKTYNGIRIQTVVHEVTEIDPKPADDAEGWKLASGKTPKTDHFSCAPEDFITYAQTENLTLWAQYSKTYNWSMITSYELTGDMIKYQIVDEDGNGITVADETTYLEYTADGIALTDANGKQAYSAKYCPQAGLNAGGNAPAKIKWYVTVPAEKNENFTYVKVTIKRADGSAATISSAETKTVADIGTANILYTDVTDCMPGNYYNVLVEAGLPKSTLISSIPIVLKVE